jgi:hypothetical protein
MNPIKVLHKGFDGLDVAFRGALRPKDIDVLEAARKEAERRFEPQLVEIGPKKIAMHVAESGARGGYAFRTDTGPLGATWFFKRGLSRDKWNIRVSLKSLPLAAFGLKEMWRQLGDQLEGMGAGAPQESIGRIDFAIDFQMPGVFELHPDRFVAHSRTVTSEHNYPISPVKLSANEFLVIYSGRRASSVTIGKMPGRQIIVYDKLHEIMCKQKLFWFHLWGINREEFSDTIWRVEIRAGKKHLKNWNITTFTDIENQIGDLMSHATQSVRYIIEDSDEKNVTRLHSDRFWRAVQKEVGSALSENISGTLPGQILAGEREQARKRRISQIRSLIPGALLASGYSEAEAETKSAEFLMEIAREIESSPEKFRERLARAKRRMHFF